MSIITDLYTNLFGKTHIKDGDVISMAEHGRTGGISTGQGFKFTSDIDENLEYAKNSSDPNILYVGTSSPGTATSVASWKIFKVDTTSGASLTRANGNSNYNNILDDRESLNYS